VIKQKFNELDVVKLTVDLSEYGLVRGVSGTLLLWERTRGLFEPSDMDGTLVNVDENIIEPA
jgi:hypothetical protein